MRIALVVLVGLEKLWVVDGDCFRCFGEFGCFDGF
jgi:hypothetical protein